MDQHKTRTTGARLKDKHQITLAAELPSLAKFRAFIQSTCEGKAGFDPQTIYDLQLATEEAITNIISHGYAGMNPGSIILELELEPDGVIMTLTDFGHPFEPVEVPSPDLEAFLQDQATTGFGLFIIYQTMDEVRYETNAYSNQLILSKKSRSRATHQEI